MTNLKPSVTLIIGLAVTAFIWSLLDYTERKNAKAEFDFEAERIHQLIGKRISSYEGLLTGVKAFFMASKEVSLQEWDIYFEKLQFENHYPGLQGIGYIQHVSTKKDIDKLKARLQTYGMSDYKIKPEGDRTDYFPVVFLEPLNHRNEKAIGYDIYSETIRRNAIESARSREATSITKKITLVQENDENIQSGLLMNIPFFTNERIDKQDLPREIDGIINAVIRMDDFITSLIEPAVLENMHMVIHDQHVSDKNILFDSHKNGKHKGFPARFKHTKVLDIYDQKWIVTLEGQPAANYLPLFYGGKSKNINLVVLLVGFAMSMLGFYLSRGLITTARLRVEKQADALSLKTDQDIIKRQEQSLLKFKDNSEYLVVCIIDIQDSTLITSQLSEHETAELYSTFDKVMNQIILKHGGTVVKSMGDAILYYFNASPSPSKDDYMTAIDCCLDMTTANEVLNNSLNHAKTHQINYRISAVYGSVMSASKNDIQDIFGSTVNRCSKINRYSRTNGLVVSHEIYELVKNEEAYHLEKAGDNIRSEYGDGVYHISKV
ncbi:MAG: CHASE domain-containing protein [Akkermansiaceae bacterium]|nr:CHASE domain-containing protein [Akkermansiaceae bacterium]